MQPRPSREPLLKAGNRFRAPQIEAEFRAEECSDGMSDRTYPYAVSVKVDAKTFEGCG